LRLGNDARIDWFANVDAPFYYGSIQRSSINSACLARSLRESAGNDHGGYRL
jgi:hypothetical protein